MTDEKTCSALERIATAFERLADAVQEINAGGVDVHVYGIDNLTIDLASLEGHSLALRSDTFSPLKVEVDIND